jgi:hypothetical protein
LHFIVVPAWHCPAPSQAPALFSDDPLHIGGVQIVSAA